MATWTEISTLANLTSFQDRVRAAMAKAAIDIVGEVQPVTESTKRQALGLKILQGGYNLLTWSYAVAAQANNTAPNEQAITDAITAIWNDMAGVVTA